MILNDDKWRLETLFPVEENKIKKKEKNGNLEVSTSNEND
jgi:hypothetical protein